jgi:hypothetical protein
MRLDDMPRSGVHNGARWTLEKRTITPALAARWVRTSRGSKLRCTKATKIHMYRRLMVTGKWRPGGVITIVDNFVVKGRHALAAVVSSGCTIEMWVLNVWTQPTSHPPLK